MSTLATPPPMERISIGTLVTLKVPCLENRPGAIGVCYEVYTLGGRAGHSFIFQNGRYDGFGPEEVDNFLQVIGMCQETSTYAFKHVVTLAEDFKKGIFDSAFVEGHIILGL